MEQLIVEHTIKMATASKTGMKYKLVSVQGKLDFINKCMLLQMLLTYIVEELEISLSALNAVISHQDTEIRQSAWARLSWRKFCQT